VREHQSRQCTKAWVPAPRLRHAGTSFAGMTIKPRTREGDFLGHDCIGSDFDVTLPRMSIHLDLCSLTVQTMFLLDPAEGLRCVDWTALFNSV